MGTIPNDPQLWAIILIGPPGSGKDTQADLLAEELELVEVKTSKLLEDAFAKTRPDDVEIQEQIRRKAAGELVDSAFTEKLLVAKIQETASAHKGIIMSGSPRTLEEAETELPVLEDKYGKFIKLINIEVGQDESVKRNRARRTCQLNGHPIPNLVEYQNITICPKDGSPIIAREDDVPETIISRYQVYQQQTKPVLEFIEKRGYAVVHINGEQSIEDIHREILNKLW